MIKMAVLLAATDILNLIENGNIKIDLFFRFFLA